MKRKHVRRVAVVGLLAAQERLVAAALGARLDLRFLPAGRRPGFPLGCDCAVLMTRFIGHGWQDAAHACFPRRQVHRCRGGTDRLIGLLTELSV